jgi:hypothetical protein
MAIAVAVVSMIFCESSPLSVVKEHRGRDAARPLVGWRDGQTANTAWLLGMVNYRQGNVRMCRIATATLNGGAMGLVLGAWLLLSQLGYKMGIPLGSI